MAAVCGWMALALCLLTVATSTLSGQQNPPVFRSATELVRLDVSVVDSSTGRPVNGLGPEDFLVFENGVRQRVRHLSEHLILANKRNAAAPVFEDVATNARQDGRRVVLVLDDATVPGDPQVLSTVRTIGRQFIDRLSDTDLAAVVFTFDNAAAVEFTANRARLRAAVDAFAPGNHSFRFDLESEPNYLRTLGTLASVIEALRSTGGQRSSVVFVSVGIPLSLAITAAPARPGLSSLGGGSAVAVQDMHRRLRAEMEALFRQAQLANVNIYTLDPAGLDGTANYIDARRRRDGVLNATMPPTPDVANMYRDFLQTTASYTGGRAVVNVNEFGEAIDEILARTASYYLVGYEPADQRLDGRFRRLEVRVTRPNTVVHTRVGYFARPLPVERAVSADTAMAGVLPASDLPLRATAVATSTFRTSSVLVAIELPAFGDPARSVEEVISVRVDAYDVGKRRVASRHVAASVTLRAGASGHYDVLTRLALPAGRYHLRAGVANARLNRAGAVYLDVDVPDFERSAVSMTHLALAPVPAAAAVRDNLGDDLALLPTPRREFASAEPVHVQGRVFQARARQVLALGVTMQVLREAKVVRDRSVDVRVEDFVDGEYSFSMPLTGLPPGIYTVVVRAVSATQAATRRVAFSVQ